MIRHRRFKRKRNYLQERIDSYPEYNENDKTDGYKKFDKDIFGFVIHDKLFNKEGFVQSTKNNCKIISGTYLYLDEITCGNYLHFIIDVLYTYYFYFYFNLTILHKRDHNIWSQEICDLLNIKTEKIKKFVVYEKIIIPFGNIHHKIYPIVKIKINEILVDNLNIPNYKRIYVSRRTESRDKDQDIIGENNTQKRKLINELEVVNYLKKYNFEEVFLEDYNFTEKVKMLNQSEIVIQCHGAGVATHFFTTNNNLIVFKGGNYTMSNRLRHYIKNNNKLQEFDCAIPSSKIMNSPWRMNIYKFKKVIDDLFVNI